MSPIRWMLCMLVVVLGLAFPAGAAAQLEAPGPPQIDAAVCETSAPWECARGARLTLSGEWLGEVTEIRFAGGPGRRDNRSARPARRDAASLDVIVPLSARSGPIVVRTLEGRRARTPRAVRVLPRLALPRAALRADVTGGVFPIAGAHSYGTETNRFGGGRGHGGQDVFAKCGTPLVALFDATVQHVASDGRAGNYVVLQGFDGQSYAYMHMQSKALVRDGQRVLAGQEVGAVGDTGRATGCHLHFEHWTAPGWYEGGEAIDPLPLLRRLDRLR